MTRRRRASPSSRGRGRFARSRASASPMRSEHVGSPRATPSTIRPRRSSWRCSAGPISTASSGSVRCSVAQVQPLLDVTREEVEAFCRSLGLRPRLDPTNRDTRRLRNALRLRGIPALERATGREIRRPIARSADLLRPVESEWLETVASGKEIGSPNGEGFRLGADALARLSPAVARGTIRAALHAMGHPAAQESIDAVLDLAVGRPGRRRDLANGLKARREREYVSLSRTSPESRV